MTAAADHHVRTFPPASDGSDDLVTPAVLWVVAEQSAGLVDREQRVVGVDLAADLDIRQALSK
jgi:hypothetical protein